MGPVDGFVGCGPQDCTPNTYPERCEGNLAVGCALGAKWTVDCAARPFYGRCGETPNGPGCEYTKECADTDPDRCDHDQLVTCNAGHWASIACKEIGFRTCGLTSTSRASCLP